MAKRFEELECWKMAIELDTDLYHFCSRTPIKNEFSLRDQMLRSVGSIADNIAEGFERGGNKELIQFLFISKGSAGELRSQFYRCKGRKLISTEEFEGFHQKCLSISAKISNLISYLKDSNLKGNKFVQPSK